MFKFLIVLTLLLVNAYTSSMPDYIEKCPLKGPTVNECFKTNANKALPHLLKGEKKLNLPNLLPLHIPHAEQQNGNLKFSLDDIKINGVDTFEITDVNVNGENNEVYYQAKIKHVEIDGAYNVNGRMLILPISGHGPFRCTLDNVTLEYTFYWDNYEKDGATYIKLVKYTFDYDAEKAHYNLENLFNGDKVLGDQMNKFLNENAMDVLKEVGTPVIDAIKLLLENCFKYIESRNTIEDIFII